MKKKTIAKVQEALADLIAACDKEHQPSEHVLNAFTELLEDRDTLLNRVVALENEMQALRNQRELTDQHERRMEERRKLHEQPYKL